MTEIRDLIGADYESVGRCWGLAALVCRRMGRELPETPAEALADPRALGVEISVPEACALVVMHNTLEDLAHVGVMLDRRYIVHATKELGVRLEELHRLGPHLVIRRYVRLEATRAQA